ncbi:hypothetical protein ABPG74_009482 [Tetrahymena malaccensis]
MKQQSLLKKINEQIVIQITTLLFLQAISTVFGDCTNATTGQNFNSAEYICALASYQISSFNNTNPNLKFPSNDCKNIQQITENGNSYYGTGGNNCDYTQPIILNFDSSPYYANRVYLFPVQWVYQSNSNCAALDISISVNNLAPKSYKLNPSKYLTQGICDYYTERFTYDNINQIVTSVSYTPGSKSKFIEQLYIIIFKCPLGCSQCDSTLKNCQNCIDGYYLQGNSCLKCDSNCKTCINSSKNCLTCQNNLYLYTDQSCQSCSGNRVFINGNNCLDCDVSCLTCDGSTSQNCKSCPSNNYLYHGNQCIPCNTDKIYISGTSCLDCDQSCLTCNGSTSKNCISCPNGSFLYHTNECVSCTGDKVYINGANCFDCDQSCLTCYGPSSNNCRSCPNGTYLYQNNRCIPCTDNGKYIKDNFCYDCHSSCQNCNGSLSTNCLSCYTGNYLYFDNSCNTCDNNNGYIIQGAYCISCSQGCKTCFGISQNQCLHCMETYQLFNKQCFQQYFNYNSSLKNETMYNIVQLIHDSSQITFLSSLLLSFINNLVSTSTFAFLMSGFVGQKFSFFLLLDVILPKYLYEILLALQKQYPTQQLRFLNVFRNWINQDITQYQSLRFEEVNISFNILQTCGQYIIIFSANMVCFLIFYYISAFAKNKKLISFSNLLYDKIFLGFMIQYCQLCLMIFVISINQQIKEFVKISEIQQIGLKLTFILILFASAGSIFYAFYKYIDYKNTKYQNINFDEITKKKLLDDIIVESNIRIHFILINLAFEAVIIPTIFIQLNEVWKAATSLSITFQLILVVITIYLRPFTTKLNNALFISNSLLWLLLYIMFLFISIFVQQPFAKNYETVLDVGIILFIVIIFILIFLPSVIMLIQLILWICDYVIKKKKQDLVKQSSNLNKIIFNKKVDIKIAKNTSYVLNRYQKEMQISNLFDELMSKRTQMVKFSKRKDLELSQLNL